MLNCFYPAENKEVKPLSYVKE